VDAANGKELRPKVVELLRVSNYKRTWGDHTLVGCSYIDYNLFAPIPATISALDKEHYRITLDALGIIGRTFEILYLLSIYKERQEIISLLSGCSEREISIAIEKASKQLKLLTTTEKPLLQELRKYNINNG
jgi:hypothetical protein